MSSYEQQATRHGHPPRPPAYPFCGDELVCGTGFKLVVVASPKETGDLGRGKNLLFRALFASYKKLTRGRT